MEASGFSEYNRSMHWCIYTYSSCFLVFFSQDAKNYFGIFFILKIHTLLLLLVEPSSTIKSRLTDCVFDWTLVKVVMTTKIKTKKYQEPKNISLTFFEKYQFFIHKICDSFTFLLIFSSKYRSSSKIWKWLAPKIQLHSIHNYNHWLTSMGEM